MKRWEEIYTERTMTAAEAVTHIKRGDRVVNSHLGGAPLPIIDAMIKNYNSYQNAEISSMLISDGLDYAQEQYKDHFHMNPWFVGKLSAEQGIQ